VVEVVVVVGVVVVVVVGVEVEVGVEAEVEVELTVMGAAAWKADTLHVVSRRKLRTSIQRTEIRSS